MTLKEKLEILCGHPIAKRVLPKDVPCIETSDATKLCKLPVVSVCMLAYNHEHFIRQAIESAINQVTDFEYEIVIAEDCSTDRTREICFEYQRKHPDKIRVLWSEENLFKIGGNDVRLFANARGEYWAILEGDDCWLDDHKLQKQVDAMRRHDNVGLCIGGGVCHNVETGVDYPRDEILFHSGLNKGKDVVRSLIFDSGKVKRGTAILTASAMMRAEYYRQANESFDPYKWKLMVGDTLWWLGLSSVSDVYCFHDIFAQYNIHAGSASATFDLEGDSAVIKAYFAIKAENKDIADLQPLHRYIFARNLIKKYAGVSKRIQKLTVPDVICFKNVFPPITGIAITLLKIGCLNRRVATALLRLAGYIKKYVYG